MLLDHTVRGIDGVYIHEKALFDRLLAAQERMSDAISLLLDPEKLPAQPGSGFEAARGRGAASGRQPSHV